MKAQKDKQSGKLKITVKKSNPIISNWQNPKTEEKAAAQFGRELRKGSSGAPLIKISERKYIRSPLAD